MPLATENVTKTCRERDAMVVRRWREGYEATPIQCGVRSPFCTRPWRRGKRGNRGEKWAGQGGTSHQSSLPCEDRILRRHGLRTLIIIRSRGSTDTSVSNLQGAGGILVNSRQRSHRRGGTFTWVQAHGVWKSHATVWKCLSPAVVERPYQSRCARSHRVRGCARFQLRGPMMQRGDATADATLLNPMKQPTIQGGVLALAHARTLSGGPH